MKYALASQRKIRLADARGVDIELSTIETIDKLMMAEALQECLECLECFVSLPSRAISLVRGHSRVSRFAQRTTEKRETARSLLQHYYLAILIASQKLEMSNRSCPREHSLRHLLNPTWTAR